MLAVWTNGCSVINGHIVKRRRSESRKRKITPAKRSKPKLQHRRSDNHKPANVHHCPPPPSHLSFLPYPGFFTFLYYHLALGDSWARTTRRIMLTYLADLQILRCPFWRLTSFRRLLWPCRYRWSYLRNVPGHSTDHPEGLPLASVA